jgi:hypothetical protein
LQISAGKLDQGIRMAILMTELRRRAEVASREGELKHLVDCIRQATAGPTARRLHRLGRSFCLRP